MSKELRMLQVCQLKVDRVLMRRKNQLRPRIWLGNKENKLSSWKNKDSVLKKKQKFMTKSKKNKEFLKEVNPDQEVKIPKY
jgi:hypothetical protein